MPPRRRVPVAEGRAALLTWADARAGGGAVDRPTTATAVRFTLEELGIRAPGRSVEVRVPPFGVVQCVEGLQHRRGTPPNVIETDADTWLALAVGTLDPATAAGDGRLRVSGTRADLTAYLPLFDDLRKVT
ncbi:sterol carrier family protein [Knoellia locipacati]|uniref:sterol carrier family protein n=1 Tax=Knoellia locipacati TaxID=882824 RepID=UPI00384D0785